MSSPAEISSKPPLLQTSSTTSPPPPASISNEIDQKYFDDFPPGYRFCPFDEELVVHYLQKKVMNQPLPKNRIVDVTLYQYNPEYLAEKYKHCGEKVWYFFTPRERKYRKGSRPSRSAGDGYWKATGADRPVKYKGSLVGFRKALVFYTGKAPKGDKTNWIMHEFRVKDSPKKDNRGTDDMTLDEWVLCRIYKKTEKPNVRTQQRDDEHSTLTPHHDGINTNDHHHHLLQQGGDNMDHYEYNSAESLEDLLFDDFRQVQVFGGGPQPRPSHLYPPEFNQISDYAFLYNKSVRGGLQEVSDEILNIPHFPFPEVDSELESYDYPPTAYPYQHHLNRLPTSNLSNNPPTINPPPDNHNHLNSLPTSNLSNNPPTINPLVK